MPIRVKCSGCGGKFRAPDELLGRTVKCPKCLTLIGVKGDERQNGVQVARRSPIPSALPLLPGNTSASVSQTRAEMPTGEFNTDSDEPLVYLNKHVPRAVKQRETRNTSTVLGLEAGTVGFLMVCVGIGAHLLQASVGLRLLGDMSNLLMFVFVAAIVLLLTGGGVSVWGIAKKEEPEFGWWGVGMALLYIVLLFSNFL